MRPDGRSVFAMPLEAFVGLTNGQAAYGRYLARTICAECHGTNSTH